ncbi:MAG: universal stress protein [Chthoniobacterales bacterium]
MTTKSQTTDPVSQRRLSESLFSQDPLRLRRIVVPVDLTSDADKGIDSAVHLAKTFGADLFLVHVYKEPYPFSYIRESSAYAGCEQHRFNTELDLLALRDHVRERYSRCFAIFRQGADIKWEISAVAKEIKADLIVVPVRHRNWFEYVCNDVCTGSDAAGIIRKAPCPVLVVHAEEQLQAA